MWKTIAALSLVTLGPEGLGRHRELTPSIELKEEAMTLEYTPARNEVVVVVEAEGETSLGEIEVRSPSGHTMLRVDARQNALQGFVIETRETDPETLFRTWREGVYDLRALTLDGQLARGRAELRHELLPAPVVVYPTEGALDVPPVLEVTWAQDPGASSYLLVVEQDENDGLTVALPGDSHSFTVPAGVLRGGTETFVEIGVVAPSGNRTLTEIRFRTR